MRSAAVLAFAAVLLIAGSAWADTRDPNGEANTTASGVRVTIVKSGGEYRVDEVAQRGGSGGPTCDVTYTRAFRMAGSERDTVIVGMECSDGGNYALVVPPSDIVDLDAAAREEAERYVEDVLTPTVRIGVNPNARGLVGLPSWFWIEGWSGSAQAPPISAFGVSIDVRMSSDGVRWDFGDGTAVDGDLGRAYPTESSVRHAYQRPGHHVVTATIALTPDYRVDGGPWITLPPLAASATTEHSVQERQAVLIER